MSSAYLRMTGNRGDELAFYLIVVIKSFPYIFINMSCFKAIINAFLVRLILVTSFFVKKLIPPFLHDGF